MKTLLFVVNSPNFDIHNRRSAIDSILCSILSELSSEYTIYVNDKRFGPDSEKLNSPIYNLSSTNKIKALVPKIVKRNINDIKDINRNQELFRKIVGEVKPDIILELMRFGSDLGLRLKNHYKIPLIAYFDSPAVEERQFFVKNFSFFESAADKNEERTILGADKVIVYTQPVVDYWKRRLKGVDERKFKIFQTLDYSRLVFKKDKSFNQVPVIGFIGSFLKWHRVDLLVEAFEELCEKGYKMNLLLIGAGEEFTSIKDQISRSKYADKITLSGFVDGEKLEAYRNSIDIGVMSGTHWYCMPTKVFEYGAAGIASIAPRTQNMRYLFKEGEDILMFEMGNKRELVEKLEYYLNNPSEIKRMGANLQKSVFERNSISKAFSFYKEIIDSTLNE